MPRNTTTDAPIHQDVIATISERYEVDEEKFAEFLARANER